MIFLVCQIWLNCLELMRFSNRTVDQESHSETSNSGTHKSGPSVMSKMYQCPKFGKCSAPVCPLYEHWKKTKLIKKKETRTCYYLRKLSEDASETDSEGGISTFLELVDVEVLEFLLGRIYQSKS